MDKKRKILIIEDEPNIRELITYNLKTNGYECLEAEEGRMGMTLAYKEKPDLILLDLMLPGKNGHEICQELRREGIGVPIIMITAKSSESDKVAGLEMGADDYITKPFGVRELLARIKALFRRVEDLEPHRDEALMMGDLSIDLRRHQVTRSGNLVDLTPKEFQLLAFLAQNREFVFSRDQLLDRVWGIDYLGESRTVDVHIRRLRKKLEDPEGAYIVTVHGKGYKMR